MIADHLALLIDERAARRPGPAAARMPLTAIRFSMVEPPATSTSRSSAVTEPEKTEAGASERAPTARTGLASRRLATVPSCGKFSAHVGDGDRNQGQATEGSEPTSRPRY